MTEQTAPAMIELMGLGVTPFESYAHAVSAVHQRIESRQKTFIAAVNPEKIYAAHRNEDTRDLLRNADFLICDGVGAALATKVLHGISIPRITGISLFMELINAASQSGHGVYLLGGAEAANALACDTLKADYPRLDIVGRHHGYFRNSEHIVDVINSKCPDILFVALGSPKQEIWIAENRHRIDAPICMGIGGTLDVVGGTVKWAPAFFRKTGTEWLYRLISEPSRWKRQLALPRFLMLLVKYKFGRVK